MQSGTSEAYRLCRMILINVGTNKHKPSERIGIIDPRDGASIVGENGVGKTTTLRLLPLFFGRPPSQIVSAKSNLESLIRFVLPTDASAIAFEYQRGNSEELRLAVIRRRPEDPSAPFYRLYRSGFRKDLFVDEGDVNEGGKKRFLTDQESQDRAAQLNIATTQKLTTSDYRAVILRSPAPTKGGEQSRRYSLDWSFGPKRLDNLDRIVATMVKDRVDFNDIKKVAVDLVRHELGYQNNDFLGINISPEQIQSWLRERQACLNAFKYDGLVKELEEHINDYSKVKAKYQSCCADVITLIKHREEQKGKLEKEISDTEKRRKEEREGENEQDKKLREDMSNLNKEHGSVKIEYETLQHKVEHFEKGKAKEWAVKLNQLQDFRLNLKNLNEQISIVEENHNDILLQYERKKSEVHKDVGNRISELERNKNELLEEYQSKIEHISAKESEAYQNAENDIERERQRIHHEKGVLLERKGSLEKEVSHPRVSEETLEAFNQKQNLWQEQKDGVHRAELDYQRLHREEQDAQRDFDDQERKVKQAKDRVSKIEEELNQARALLDPKPGTLLAALRSSKNEDWKRNLARTINSELLKREDLQPKFIEENAFSFYGWSINTDVLTSPDWVDDTLARKNIEDIEYKLGRANADKEAQQELLNQKSRKLQESKQATRQAQAHHFKENEKLEQAYRQYEMAKKRVEEEKRQAASQAKKDLDDLLTALRGIENQLSSLNEELNARRKDIKISYKKQRDEVLRQRNALIKEIEENIRRNEAYRDETLKDFERQKEEHLRKGGVDVQNLNELKQRRDKLEQEIREIEDHKPLVELWMEWVKENGDAKIAESKEKMRALDNKIRGLLAQLELLSQRNKENENKYKETIKKLQDKKNLIEADIQTLENLKARFDDLSVLTEETAIPPEASVQEVKSRFEFLKKELGRVKNRMQLNAQKLYIDLTSEPSNVSKFVMNEAPGGASALDGDELARYAWDLCACFKRIPDQVVVSINQTFVGILQNLNAFYKAIKNFEHGVRGFNKRLQEGLSEVKCFDRVKDLRLELVTHFEEFGLYKRLCDLEDLIRQYIMMDANNQDELPSDEAANHLSEIARYLNKNGRTDIDLFSNLMIKGSVIDNGIRKEFKSAEELKSISSEGLTALILITLMTALLNTIRGTDPVYIPWVADEVGRFDTKNFGALIQRLKDNHIDIITAAPQLSTSQQEMFAHRYIFEDKGIIREVKTIQAVPVT